MSQTPSRRVLIRAMMLTSAAAVVAIAGAYVVAGEAAAFAVLCGASLTCLVMFSGSLAVEIVSRVLPQASLLVALLTYTLQLAFLGVTFVALSEVTWQGALLPQGWVAGAVIAVTGAWVVTQIALATTARIPAFELSSGARNHGSEAGAR